MSKIENTSVNAIRILAAEMIQKAKSGHPGLPMGCAPIAYELWGNHMNHNPKNPKWLNRDSFHPVWRSWFCYAVFPAASLWLWPDYGGSEELPSVGFSDSWPS